MSASAHASTSVPAPVFPAASQCAALLVLVWVVAMGALLWHFETLRMAQTQQLFHFDASGLPAPPAAHGSAKAVYFIDPQCRCSGAALAEIRRLQRSAMLPSTQFIYTPSATASAAFGVDARPLDAVGRARWRSFAPATPAVALWDARDRLVYFGPISADSLCGASASAKNYLQIALQSLRQTLSRHSAMQSTQESMEVSFKAWDVVACACPASAHS